MKNQFTDEELSQALVCLSSLVSKSEKAQKKLKCGTWQRTMLQSNIDALNLAISLMRQDTVPKAALAELDLSAAYHAVASMIDRSTRAQSKLVNGSSSHTLLVNRVKALNIARRFIEEINDAKPNGES